MKLERDLFPACLKWTHGSFSKNGEITARKNVQRKFAVYM